MCGKGGHRIFAPVPDQVLGKLALFFGYGRVPLHHFRVDYGHVQTGLNAVIQENRVEHFATGRRQAERNVGDAQNRFSVGQGLFNQPNSLNGFGGGTHVVCVARAGREYQRVENDVLFRNAVLFRQQFVRAPGYFQLAFPGNCLGLFLVIVDATHHQRGPVGPGQWGHRLEAGLPVLQVH